MARDANGTYTLPLAAVAAATTITSSWANTTMTDLASALTDSLSRSGDGAMTAPLKLISGIVSAPAVTFSDETTLGFFRKAAGEMVAVAGSTDLLSLTIARALFSKTVIFSKGADVVSIAALALGTDGNYFDITGTTAITSIVTKGVGTIVKLHFDAVLILTHHATDLVLPNDQDILTAVDDEAEFIEYATGDWRLLNYQSRSGVPHRVFKPANESVASSNVLQDDDDLVIILAADSFYEINFFLVAHSFSATPDIKIQFIEPDGGYRGTVISSGLTVVTLINDVSAASVFALPASTSILIKGTIIAATSGAGGNFQLQWAQNTSNATATIVRKGSWMEAKKLS